MLYLKTQSFFTNTIQGAKITSFALLEESGFSASGETAEKATNETTEKVAEQLPGEATDETTEKATDEMTKNAFIQTSNEPSSQTIDNALDQQTQKPNAKPYEPKPCKLWAPFRPGGSNTRYRLPYAIGSKLGHFRPTVNIEFGGYKGRLLGQLTQIHVYTFKRRTGVVGLAFEYADGSERIFGSPKDRPRLSHAIDGPGGERVTEVVLGHRHYHICPSEVMSLRLLTNRDRCIELLNEDRRWPVQPTPHLALRPKQGVITGLVAEWDVS